MDGSPRPRDTGLHLRRQIVGADLQRAAISRPRITVVVGVVIAASVARQRWNPEDKWVFSQQAHPLIITKDDLDLTQATLAGQGSKSQHRPHAGPAPTPRAAPCCAGGR